MIELGMYSEIRELNQVVKCLMVLLKIDSRSVFSTIVANMDQFSRSGETSLREISYKEHQYQKRETLKAIGDYEATEMDEDNVRDIIGNKHKDPDLISSSKWIACKILIRILEIQNECRVNSILFKFKNITHLYLSEKSNGGVIISKKNYEDLLLGESLSDTTTHQLQPNLLRSFLSGVKDNYFIDLKRDKETSAILLNLTLQPDLKLKTESLRLLYLLHSPITIIKQNIEETVLLDAANTKMSFPDCHNLSRALRRLSETVEKWYFNAGSAHHLAFENIVNIIETHLIQKVIKKIPGSTTPASDEEKTENLNSEVPYLEFHLWNETRSVINPYYQNIFRHIEVYSSLLKILETDLNKGLKENTKLEVLDKTGNKQNEIVKRIFLILVYACVDNQDNKSYLSKYMNGVILNQFENNPNSMAILMFFHEYAKDNLHLLRADEDSAWIEKMLGKLIKMKRGDQKKIVILSTLGLLTRYFGTINQHNQNYLCETVLNTKNKVSLLDLTNPSVLQVLKDQSLLPPPEYKLPDCDLISQIGEIGYATVVIWFLRRVSEGRNSQTENITQIMLPLSSIGSLFQKCPEDYSYSFQLLSFFHSVHLYATRRLPPQTDDILVEITHLLSSMLKSFVNINFMTMKDCYRSSGTFIQRNDAFMLDFYGRVVDCIFAIMVHVKSFSNIVRDSKEEQLVCDLLEGAFGYYNIAKNDNHRISSLHLITHLMLRTPDHIAIKSKEMHIEEFKDVQGAIIAKGGLISSGVSHKKHTTRLIKQGMTNKKFYHNSTKSITQNSLKHKKSILEKIYGKVPPEAAFVELMRSTMGQFFNSESFRELADGEFQGLVETINGADDEGKKKGLSKNKKREDAKSISGFFHSMIQFLIWETTKIPEELILIILQIFIDFLKGGNESSSNQDEWKGRKLLAYRQSILIKLDLIELIYKLLSNDRSNEITMKTVKLGIAVLEGGNKMGQMDFLENMGNDRLNSAFRSLYELLDFSFEGLESHLTAKQEIMVQGILHDDFGFGGSSSIVPPKLNNEIRENNTAKEGNSSIHYIDTIKNILRFLQLLCEGHNIELQNAVREQHWVKSSNQNRDFVEYGSRMMASFAKVNDKLSYDLGIQLLDFLVEVIQGPCPENQVALIKHKIIDSCKDLLNDISTKKDFNMIWGEDSQEELDFLANLVSKSRLLLSSLLEGDTEKGRAILVAENLNVEFLAQTIHSELLSFIERKVKDKVIPNKYKKNLEDFLENYMRFASRDFFDEKIIEAFQTFFFLQLIVEESESHSITLKKLSPNVLLALQFYRENSNSVEVVFKGSLLKIDFPIHPACRHLTKIMRQEFIKKYNRESPNEKIVQFIRSTPQFMDRMDYHIAMSTSSLSITTKTFKYLRDATLIVSLLINLVHFVFSDIKLIGGEVTVRLDLPEPQIIKLVFGFLHLLFTSLTSLVWFYVFGPLVHMDSWLLKVKEIRASVLPNDDQSEKKELCKIILQKNVVDQTFSDKLNLLSYTQSYERSSIGVTSHISLLGYILFDLLKDNNFKYFLFFVLFSAIAFVFDMPIFYALQLFDIIVRLYHHSG